MCVPLQQGLQHRCTHSQCFSSRSTCAALATYRELHTSSASCASKLICWPVASTQLHSTARPEPASPSTPSLNPELWVQKGKSNRPPYAQNASLTPCHNKGYFGCVQPCSSLLPQTSSLGKMPSFFLLLPQNKQTKNPPQQVVTHICHLSTQEAKEGGLLWVQGHPGPQWQPSRNKNNWQPPRQGKSAPVLFSLCSSKSPGPQSKTCSTPALFAQSKFPLHTILQSLHYKEHFSVTLLALVSLSTDFPGLISTYISSIQYFAYPA